MNKFKKIVLCGGVFALYTSLSAVLFAQTDKTAYISPNNDGVQDELVVPMTIRDKRYINEWSLPIKTEIPCEQSEIKKSDRNV